uniref:Liver x receptor alpha transcript variant 2 n=1 Tax=Tachysurus fulvidraco TaxID=1234273 RepID=A0A139Z792_TACFU|nr:liver x receptor alpha transcript variant 2 [Tachysurus fulvidraco]
MMTTLSETDIADVGHVENLGCVTEEVSVSTAEVKHELQTSPSQPTSYTSSPKELSDTLHMDPSDVKLDPSSDTPAPVGQPVKRKKGPAPKMLGNEVCSVCGDKASGFHYNVLSCEGCKGFLRRSVIKGAQYVCKNSGRCEMDMYMRRKCQQCRLRKCREAGMLEQCVLSEEQIRLKKMKKQHDEEAGRSSTMSAPSPAADIPPLAPEQQEMIEKLVAMQKQSNKRSFIDRRKVTPWPQSQDPMNREVRQQRFAHFTELAFMSVQEIVDFAKQLPGFLELTREDQIALLKTSTIEVSLPSGHFDWILYLFFCVLSHANIHSWTNVPLLGLPLLSTLCPLVVVNGYHTFFSLFLLQYCGLFLHRSIMLLETSRRYNPAIESITFLTPDFSYNKEDFAKAGLQIEFINPIFEFPKGMNDLHLDEAEYALLIAINIFSADRPNVQDHDLVEKLQQPYVDALHSYIRIKRPNDHLMFPRMLMKLVSLRTLSSVHSEQVFALRLQDKKLPPLLSEIWDVHE